MTTAGWSSPRCYYSGGDIVLPHNAVVLEARYSPVIVSLPFSLLGHAFGHFSPFAVERTKTFRTKKLCRKLIVFNYDSLSPRKHPCGEMAKVANKEDCNSLSLWMRPMGKTMRESIGHFPGTTKKTSPSPPRIWSFLPRVSEAGGFLAGKCQRTERRAWSIGPRVKSKGRTHSLDHQSPMRLKKSSQTKRA